MKRFVKVLVVEDSEDDTRLAMQMLRRSGLNPAFERVQDVEALRTALVRETWDAVLSDFRMPGFTGVEALSVFLATGLDIPFIFISGTIGEEAAVAAMKAGASDYVMKENLTRLGPVLERELDQATIRAAHRQGQIDLEVSRDRYVDLYDFAPVGYLTLSNAGLIEQVNLTAAEMLQTARATLLQTRFDEHVAVADQARWLQQFRLSLDHGERRRFELELASPGGSPLHVQFDCARVAGGSAAPWVRVALTDITSRKEAEVNMRHVEAQLWAAQKMESLGTLAGGIAHDFNNILGAILGNVMLIGEELAADHPCRMPLDEIHKSSLRARNLVHQILTFSRREPQELVVQPLQAVVEETHKLLRATLPAGVEVDVALSEVPLLVNANATQVQQALMNLCTNAWHALADGTGRIELGIAAVTLDADGARRVGSVVIGEYAHLWVADTGVGMDASTRERVFEPFFTTKPVGQGTGLGLAVVHGIVSAHQGTIVVDSAVGVGSTFHVYLPLAEVGAAAGAVEAASVPAPDGQGQHVLYVDDDETMVIVIGSILQRAGYRVTSLNDAHQAMQLIRDDPTDFDIVISDFNMPDVSGLDIARMIASIDPLLPVIIGSGYITDELRTQARMLGVRALLRKENVAQELRPLLASVFLGVPPRKRS